MILYRIAQEDYAQSGAQMMDGKGGLYASARWHTKGHRIVYTATSRPLAVLEIAVNLKRHDKLPIYKLLEIDVPDNLVVSLSGSGRALPEGWDEREGEPIVSRAIGDKWQELGVSVGMRVPSVIIPAEDIVLLNPEHEDYGEITYGDPVEFPFDPRIKA